MSEIFVSKIILSSSLSTSSPFYRHGIQNCLLWVSGELSSKLKVKRNQTQRKIPWHLLNLLWEAIAATQAHLLGLVTWIWHPYCNPPVKVAVSDQPILYTGVYNCSQQQSLLVWGWCSVFLWGPSRNRGTLEPWNPYCSAVGLQNWVDFTNSKSIYVHFTRVYVYIYIYISIYVCMCVYIYMYIYIYMCV